MGSSFSQTSSHYFAVPVFERSFLQSCSISTMQRSSGSISSSLEEVFSTLFGSSSSQYFSSTKSSFNYLLFIIYMFKLNPKKVLLRVPTIYDYQPTVPEETRKAIVLKVMEKHPNLQVKGGNSLTNPYKIPYELALAERIEAMEKYKNSILWSPRMTPKKFTFAFIYPMGFALVLLWYIHNVAIPRKMVEWKRNRGYVFPELESKGWLDGWWDYSESEQEDIFDMANMRFKKSADKVLDKPPTDFTIRDLQNFGTKIPYEKAQEQQKQPKPLMQAKEKAKIQKAFQKISTMREDQSQQQGDSKVA